jgi:aminopeptidase N
MTVYQKGAEIIRMYHTLLGEEGFQKGMKLYFRRHDHEAVTCDDFRAAMADANGLNLDEPGPVRSLVRTVGHARTDGSRRLR